MSVFCCAAAGVASIALPAKAPASASAAANALNLAEIISVPFTCGGPWLSAHGVTPVNYGDGLADRLRAEAPNGRIDAFLDLFGGGYVELALTQLGIDPQRVSGRTLWLDPETGALCLLDTMTYARLRVAGNARGLATGSGVDPDRRREL